MKNPFGIKPIVIKFGEHVKEHKRRPIDKNTRKLVWEKYFGLKKFSGKCYCCKERVIYKDEFQVGHNKAVSKGGLDHINNLRPICARCNSSMRTMTIEQYKRKLQPPKRRLKKTRKPARKRNYLGGSILDLPKKRGKGLRGYLGGI